MKRLYFICGQIIGLVLVALFGVLGPTGPSHGKVTRVVVEASGPMGNFGSREYLWATGVMEGTVDRGDGVTGRYRVPIVLMYPDREYEIEAFYNNTTDHDIDAMAQIDLYYHPVNNEKITYPTGPDD